MDGLLSDELPLPQKLAFAHANERVKVRLDAFFALDARLGQFVSQSKEPMLTQMRIAWWRDQFGKTAENRPQGDPILDRLSDLWAGEEQALIALVDGWEALLAEPPLPAIAALDFANGRAACFAALARLCGNPAVSDIAASHGRSWALADLASRVSDLEERGVIIAQALGHRDGFKSLPFRLRALTILGRLGRRAVDNGGAPLIGGRKDIAIVMRLGLFGK